ncbi:transcriptional regulator, TetR family [Jatrophihabitans endophyticus]|uniref:Transcriptional regulator, TetR family n=1 Tax=Jatrophihabitans endophyticus TaxID=1206085 RepID=A0A1M5ICH7_9ACTN|nr:TetR/AcrR family transcriptional regulator [Jatrophihabitans endophyticus]SHG25972.1 transcriptional regulator, TetR family [Jatrophihabitans endophyticus]
MPTPAAPQRRRGAALERAILDAAYAELVDVGYAAFAVEGVAARARTGKASIYRRWPSRQELVTDALVTHLPGPDDRSLAIGEMFGGDVTTADALRTVGGLIVQVLASPAGRVLRAVKLEAVTDPALAALVDDRFQAPRRAAMLALLERGVRRGEVRPEAATPLVADVLPAVIAHHMFLQDRTVSDADVAAIIEQIMIPLVSAG